MTADEQWRRLARQAKRQRLPYGIAPLFPRRAKAGGEATQEGEGIHLGSTASECFGMFGSRKTPTPTPTPTSTPSSSAPFECDVCGEDTECLGSWLMSCDLCGLVVHSDCYGIPPIDSEEE
eukprot:CAMPEP_0175057558 /NCGR_PEP_ID=MMETSP0052_2-20121109/11327_1 /TAXON_ID=51329 ORGANISM="Polytomella parva, Strain SAG 63-3" /NCGR_SAMPLE_ID=MMETSP0052_2 /ASSEMBLY_ACC=CAM_ASM_000194 /LENGTH=120 /DNA_ID=CAMNT_0016322777 /DNA_START=346 /DNA_END=705 /DNA_ORIENTATION=-